MVGERDRFVSFDSRDIFFNGGVDIENETITFTSEHNFENGQLVYYNSNGNSPIGIGTAFDLENKISGTLSDGAPYFVRSINPSTVRLFNTRVDALFGTKLSSISEPRSIGLILFCLVIILYVILG